jgi:hypothetical protein
MTSSFLKVFGAVVVLAVSFFATLLALRQWDTGKEAQTFEQIVEKLMDRAAVTIVLDDNPAEDRDAEGRIVCGPETSKGYLGVFEAGQKYIVKYDPAKMVWTTTGPQQATSFDPATHSCKIFSDAYDMTKPAALKASPQRGQLILWGALMTFDADLAVFDASGRKIGHIQ